MRLVLFTPPDTAAAEHTAVNRLFCAGLEVLHLRKPSYSRHHVIQYLQKVEPQWRHRIVLHQHHDLAAEFALKGIHYKEKNRPPPPIGRAYPAMTQSTSLHDLEDVVQDWQNLDYAFLSPIFDSISKEGYPAAAFPQEKLIAALQKAQMPVYALGGIVPNKLQQVQELGFAGVGVLGAVWGADDPVAALKAFQEHM